MTLGRARTMELTALLVAVGLMLALAAVSYSMLRFNRLL
jgi:hypothetical protein